MILSSFQVKNFRSIVEADFPLSDVTVLLGKNNEGKSNILRAFTIAMRILESHSEVREQKRLVERYEGYEWERDYPKNLQVGGKKKRDDRVTSFGMKFRLDAEEIDSFKKEIGHVLNGELPIEIKLGPDDRPRIKVVKSGKGSKPLNAKSKKIAMYISKLISYNAIPAIRTQEDSYRVVNNLVRRELDKLYENKEYKEALKVLNDLRKPVLESVSQNINDVLKDFIPNIKSVIVDVNERRGYRLNPYDSYIIIDDGQKTDLEDKGDGIKSLVTLGLLQNQWIKGGASIVAFEEPESHLHPEAINRLRETLFSLATNNQVIITTHNPLFVNREKIQSNIIVNGGKARVAHSVRDIREVLGVKISDNLFDAKLAILVEGITDEISLKSILSEISPSIKKAIVDHTLTILPIRGVKNLGYYVNMFRTLVASFYCVLDNDRAAQQELSMLLNKKVLSSRDYVCITIPGHKEVELEDTFDISFYSDFLYEKYGVDVTSAPFKRRDIKWSEKLKQLFVDSGKIYDKDIEETIKYELAQKVENKNGKGVITPDAEAYFHSIVKTVEKLL